MTYRTNLIFLVIIFCGIFGFTQNSQADTHNVVNTSGQPSCEQVDVQRAINSASDGDTVFVPAGSCTFDTVVSIGNKQLTIKGAGIGKTIIYNQINGTSTSDAAFSFDSQSKAFHISDLEIRGVIGFTGGEPTHAAGIYFKGAATNWRIHHIKFYNIYKNRAIWIAHTGATTKGVIDHIDFTVDSSSFCSSVNQVMEVVGAQDAGWQNDVVYGDDNAVYIEDSTFSYSDTCGTNRSLIDGRAGASWVIRYNTLVNAALHAHGAGDNPGYAHNRGVRRWEIYNNTIKHFPSETYYAPIQFRSGTGMIYNNKICGNFGHGPMFNCYRAVGQYNPTWGPCDGTGIEGHAGASPPGYPCLDCTGRGKDTDSEQTPYAAYPTPEYSEQATVPAYVWGNLKYTASDCTGSSSTATASSSALTHVKENIDFFNCADKADCVSKGMSPSYDAYTYPHPLTLGDDYTPPSAPQGLVVQ